MKPAQIDFLNTALKQLALEQTPIAYDVAFLQSVLGSTAVAEKIGNSFAGHAADIQIRAVIAKVAMFNSRALDREGHSLPKVAGLLGSAGAHIRDCRLADHPEWPKRALGLDTLNEDIQDFARAVYELFRSEEALKQRLYRDEHLAHLLAGRSSIRKSLGHKSKDYEGITYAEVVSICVKCLELISKARQIWSFELYSIEDTIALARRYCDEYWRVFPVLKSVENL